jgi:hypothetical protein
MDYNRPIINTNGANIMIEEVKKVVKMWSKPVTQDTIKVLKQAGLTVVKTHFGYSCHVGDHLVFKALNGTQGYLVTYDEDLFE